MVVTGWLVVLFISCSTKTPVHVRTFLYIYPMNIGDKLDGYHVMLIETLFTGSESLEKIKTIAEGCKSVFTLRIIGDEYYDKLAPLLVETFERDLTIITNVIAYPDEDKEDGFNRAKGFLLKDLEGVIGALGSIP